MDVTHVVTVGDAVKMEKHGVELGPQVQTAVLVPSERRLHLTGRIDVSHAAGDQGFAPGLPRRPPVFRRLAADVVFYAVEFSDSSQRLFGDRRWPGDVNVVELPPRVGPAGGLDDVGLGVCLGRVKLVEAGVAIRLQRALELGQVLPGVFALAVGTVEVDRPRRRRAAPRPIVAHIDPKPSRFGATPAG